MHAGVAGGRRVFTDPCDETVVIDGDGDDLPRYEVTVTDDGDRGGDHTTW